MIISKPASLFLTSYVSPKTKSKNALTCFLKAYGCKTKTFSTQSLKNKALHLAHDLPEPWKTIYPEKRINPHLCTMVADQALA
ncbi:hypothetical protein GS501_02970 [Saccharibacter sp. 17.LH.SD]|uniref:hypothetical protein n=1 Tax=Saccharibacter sp. 17.LH.SD TaxID=2689393 RepID=UPI00136F41C7|nr:hypothetical protein [Saccharibacter sp. 17.LH.SD]MXV44015.1 hypothetical protein [Saccharibacter sp. 17.LH.SD]